jgi:heme-degrading monooxygenase HmoA
MTDAFAITPEPPYYAVVFTTKRAPGDNGYHAMADAMTALAAKQPGYLGVESARSENGVGITVSYWEDEASIAAWKSETRHALAQRAGQELWYEHYELRVAKVERAYSGPEGRAKAGG